MHGWIWRQINSKDYSDPSHNFMVRHIIQNLLLIWFCIIRNTFKPKINARFVNNFAAKFVRIRCFRRILFLGESCMRHVNRFEFVISIEILCMRFYFCFTIFETICCQGYNEFIHVYSRLFETQSIFLVFYFVILYFNNIFQFTLLFFFLRWVCSDSFVNWLLLSGTASYIKWRFFKRLRLIWCVSSRRFSIWTFNKMNRK